MRFIRGFAIGALILSSWQLVISSPVLVFLATADGYQTVSADYGGTAELVMEHILLFVTLFWVYSAAGVVASIGLLRRRRWGHTLWIGLLTVACLWGLVVIGSETFAAVTTGDLERQSLLWVTVFVPLVLIATGGLFFLLLKLVSARGGGGHAR